MRSDRELGHVTNIHYLVTIDVGVVIRCIYSIAQRTTFELQAAMEEVDNIIIATLKDIGW